MGDDIDAYRRLVALVEPLADKIGNSTVGGDDTVPSRDLFADLTMLELGNYGVIVTESSAPDGLFGRDVTVALVPREPLRRIQVNDDWPDPATMLADVRTACERNKRRYIDPPEPENRKNRRIRYHYRDTKPALDLDKRDVRRKMQRNSRRRNRK